MGFNFFDVPDEKIKAAAGTGSSGRGIRLYPPGLYIIKVDEIVGRDSVRDDNPTPIAWINTKISVHALIEKGTKEMRQPDGSGFIFQSFFLIKKDGTKNTFQEEVYTSFIAALSGYDTQKELSDNFGPDEGITSTIDIIHSMADKAANFAGKFLVGFIRVNEKNTDKDGNLKPCNEINSFNAMYPDQVTKFEEFVTPSAPAQVETPVEPPNAPTAVAHGSAPSPQPIAPASAHTTALPQDVNQFEEDDLPF